MPHAAPLQPMFVDGPAGPIFTLRFQTQVERRAPAALLVPPFGEEMNRSRRFLAANARALAAQGCSAVLADLHGTGDSAGDFSDATWSIWQAEVDTLTRRLADESGHSVHLIAVRTGALLAAATARRRPESVRGLTLIQPVTDGRRFLDQLLRVRVAASMTQGRRENRDALRTSWQTGDSVEVGGYAIAPGLAEELTACRLSELPPPQGMSVDWIDVVAPASDLATTLPSLPGGWDSERIARRRVQAPAVWQMAEPDTADPLVHAVMDRITSQRVPA